MISFAAIAKLLLSPRATEVTVVTRICISHLLSVLFTQVGKGGDAADGISKIGLAVRQIQESKEWIFATYDILEGWMTVPKPEMYIPDDVHSGAVNLLLFLFDKLPFGPYWSPVPVPRLVIANIDDINSLSIRWDQFSIDIEYPDASFQDLRVHVIWSTSKCGDQVFEYPEKKHDCYAKVLQLIMGYFYSPLSYSK
jgi:hypothetical protein